MAGINDILRPYAFTELISQKGIASDVYLQRFGMMIGGRNEIFKGIGRVGYYHIYNHVRTVGQGRAPGTAAARSPRNNLGQTAFTVPRMHDSITLLGEEIHNLANIEDPRQRDIQGIKYVEKQSETLMEKAKNFRLCQLIGMLKDSLYAVISGNSYYFTWDPNAGGIQIPVGMPTGNRDQLDMLGDGDIIDLPWDNPNANIPLMLRMVDAAFQSLNGSRLSDIDCPQRVWDMVVNNDYVIGQHGIANVPYDSYKRQVGTYADGRPINEFVAELKCMPGVTWHISDSVLDIGAPGQETSTKFWDDDKVLFSCEDKGQWKCECGSEPIAEYDGAPELVKIGFSAWTVSKANPTCKQCFILDNCYIYNDVPTTNAYATVTGF